MSIKICIESSMSFGLSSLYKRQEMTDVRMVCTDGQVMAHKVVLSAVSDTFRQLLSSEASNQTSIAVIILYEFFVKDIKAIVDCIYFGNLSIELNRFSHLSRIGARFGITLRSAVSLALGECGHSNRTLEQTSGVEYGQNDGFSPRDCLMSMTLDVNDNQFISSEDPFPLNLSISGIRTTVEDNVSKTIDSVATNGPQEKSVRRRKQMNPTGLLKNSKLGFNNDVNQCFGQMKCPIDSDLNEPIEYLPDMASSSVSFPDDQPMAISSAVMNTESHMNKVALKPKPSIKSKTKIFCGSELKECCVCGQSLPTYKQLISHLNKEHKTNDIFKCVCGKEQKYAKTFAIHAIQCRQMIPL